MEIDASVLSDLNNDRDCKIFRINYFLNIFGQNKDRAIKAQRVSCGGERLVATSW